MARAKKKKSSGSEGSSAASAEGGAGGGSKLWLVFVGLLVLLLGAGAFVVWHRGKDPARQQARTWDRLHHEHLDQRVDRCFGGSTAAAIRALEPAIRQGRLPQPFHDCSGMRFVEVMESPVAFIADLSHPVATAEQAQARERLRLQRLFTTLRRVERATVALDRSQPIPEASREPIATALDDLANDLDQEHQSFGALLMDTENAASWW